MAESQLQPWYCNNNLLDSLEIWQTLLTVKILSSMFRIDMILQLTYRKRSINCKNGGKREKERNDWFGCFDKINKEKDRAYEVIKWFSNHIDKNTKWVISYVFIKRKM